MTSAVENQNWLHAKTSPFRPGEAWLAAQMTNFEPVRAPWDNSPQHVVFVEMTMEVNGREGHERPQID